MLIAACVAYRPYSVACFLVYFMTLCQLHKLYGLEWWGCTVYCRRKLSHCIVFVIPAFAYGNWGEPRIIKQSLLLRTDILKRGNVCCSEQGRNPSDATSCWFCQEIPGILCNLKVYYRIHNCLSLIFIMNPLYTLLF